MKKVKKEKKVIHSDAKIILNLYSTFSPRIKPWVHLRWHHSTESMLLLLFFKRKTRYFTFFRDQTVFNSAEISNLRTNFLNTQELLKNESSGAWEDIKIQAHRERWSLVSRDSLHTCKHEEEEVSSNPWMVRVIDDYTHAWIPDATA